jgi:hypothetical protein
MNRRNLGRILRLEKIVPHPRWDFSHVPTQELKRLERAAFEMLLDNKTGKPLPEHTAHISFLYGSFEAARSFLYEEADGMSVSR